MRGPKFTLGALQPWNVSSEKIWGGPHSTLGVLHSEMPLAEKLSFPKSALDPI